MQDLLVKKFREVFSTGAVYVNYRAFLNAMRAINEEGTAPESVRDTAGFRFDLRKGVAPPQFHRIPAPEETAWQDVKGLTELSVMQKIKKHVSGDLCVCVCWGAGGYQ